MPTAEPSPLLVFPGALDSALIQWLVADLNKDALYAAPVGRAGVVDDARRSLMCVLSRDDRNYEPLYETLDGLAHSAADQLRIAIEAPFESLQYTVYERGGYYRYHRDSEAPGPDQPSTRLVSTSLLIQDAAAGGRLEFIDSLGAVTVMRPEAGSAVFFPSSVRHTVSPVRSGRRVSLVMWWCGAADQWALPAALAMRPGRPRDTH